MSKKILGPFTPSGKSCVVIQSLVLNKWTSTSSSGLPEYSGLKCNQFICIWACWPGCGCCGMGGGGGGSSLQGQGLAVHLLPFFSIYIFTTTSTNVNYTTSLLCLVISWLCSFTTTYLFTNTVLKETCKPNTFSPSK